MSHQNTAHPAIRTVVAQLKVESEYLDTVIESSKEMQTILRASRGAAPTSSPPATGNEVRQPATTAGETVLKRTESPIVVSGLQAEFNEQLNARMAALRTKLETDFLPVVSGRKTMIGVLKSLDPTAEQTPTLSEIAARVEGPLKSDLKRLRSEIRSKLNQIHSISMGNQAVLLYTLDFYNRLLAGLSGDPEQSSYYNANGRSQHHTSGSIVRTNC